MRTAVGDDESVQTFHRGGFIDEAGTTKNKGQANQGRAKDGDGGETDKWEVQTHIFMPCI